MAALFAAGLWLYYFAALRRKAFRHSALARLLWLLYLFLAVSGTFIAVTDVLRPVYDPNYWSTLFLLLCILMCISGFAGFRDKDVAQVFQSIRGQKAIENFLIAAQFIAIAFFIPFALSSLSGDANENRLQLADKMEVLGSFGLLNTFCGAASQLFSASLVLAFIRLSSREGRGRHVGRALVLIFCSLSYVIYILAYVGRDGVVYWLMTAMMVFLVFRNHLSQPDKRNILAFGALLAGLLLIPFLAITVSRFFDADLGGSWSLPEYFGAQIHHFSDYSSIERPLTFGIANFSMFVNAGCSLAGVECDLWPSVKEFIFDQYLAQGKEPWLFGTFVSDFVADFGFAGTFVLILFFSLLCHWVCTGYKPKRQLTLPRLLLVLFLFLVPYWGVFYFRFSIINGYIVVNLIFILGIALLQRAAPVKAARGFGASTKSVLLQTTLESRPSQAVRAQAPEGDLPATPRSRVSRPLRSKRPTTR